MLPLDIISGEDIGRLIDMALANFDYVIIDMPLTVVAWTEAVLTRAHVYFALIDLDLRSAQNVCALSAPSRPRRCRMKKLRYVLNRAPKFTDLSAKSRVKRMARKPGHRHRGATARRRHPGHPGQRPWLPLSESAAKNPLRKELQKLAKSLHDLNKAAEAGKA